MNDVAQVGGKNASLGEMISNLTELGIRVPGGFATTALAYRDFLNHRDDGEASLAERINARLSNLDIDDVTALAAAGKAIRGMIMAAPLQDRLQQEIESAWRQMVAEHGDELAVAVRSSATAEDLPEASFAGQQETFLNVRFTTTAR
jgi:pyruvate,water dikinase